MKTTDLIAEAIALPVEERTMVVDSLLKSLNPPDTDIDKKWASVARRRLAELRSGEVKAVPGDEVFKKPGRNFQGEILIPSRGGGRVRSGHRLL